MQGFIRRAALTLAFLLCAVPALATNYYVATTGANSTCGAATNISTPALTVPFGIACMSGGDFLYIRTGTYNGKIGGGTTLPSGSSYSNAINIQPYASEVVILTATGDDAILDPAHGESYYIWTDIIFDGSGGIGFDIGGNNRPHHFRFIGGEIRDATRSGCTCHSDNWEFLGVDVHDNGTVSTSMVPQDHGLYISGADNVVDGGNYYNNWGYGIQIYDSGVFTYDNNVIKNAFIYNNGRADDSGMGLAGGFILSSGDNLMAFNNVVYGNSGSSSIAESNNCGSCFFINNTLYNNGGFGILIGAGSTSGTVKNNITYISGSAAIHDLGTSTNAGAGTASFNITTDPSFTNAGAADFTLILGSPAIDPAGATDLSPYLTTDIIGTARPQGVRFDYGAYEFAADPDDPFPVFTALVGSSNTNTATTVAADTRTATLIFAAVIDHFDLPGSSFSDSLGNTWTALTPRSSEDSRVSAFYCSPCTTGAAHTFTGTSTGGYPSVVVAGYLLYGLFESQTGTFNNNAMTVQPGSITPAQNNEIVLTAVGFNDAATVTINGSYIITNQLPYSAGNYFGAALGYIVQTSAAATNPTWTSSLTVDFATVMASFRLSSSGIQVRTFGLTGVGR